MGAIGYKSIAIPLSYAGTKKKIKMGALGKKSIEQTSIFKESESYHSPMLSFTVSMPRDLSPPCITPQIQGSLEHKALLESLRGISPVKA